MTKTSTKKSAKKEPLFSIVIPARNSNSKYLGDCLSSIATNSFQNFEVIVVFDDPGNCLNEYGLDNRFLSIRLEREVSIGEARNIGLRFAKGKYVLFVDSDDEIEKNFLKAAYSLLLQHPNDPLIFDINKDKNWGFLNDMKTSVVDTSTLHPLLMGFLGGSPVERTPPYYSVWGKVFPMTLLKDFGVFFPKERMTGEDTLFVANAIWLTRQVVEIKGYRPYYYRWHQQNTMGNLSLDKVGLLSFFEYVEHLKNLLPFSENERLALLKVQSLFYVRRIRETYCLLAKRIRLSRREKKACLSAITPQKKTLLWHRMKQRGALKISQRIERFLLIRRWLSLYTFLFDFVIDRT